MHAREPGALDLPDPVALAASLQVPPRPRGVVVLAHDRLGARSRAVASRLRSAELSTLPVDLLAGAEERDESRPDLDRLTRRLVAVVRWTTQRSAVAGAPVGLLGIGIAGAAALRAAVELGPLVHAVVSPAGRPDLAGAALPLVQAPTLLIVGGADSEGLVSGRQAKDALPRDTVAAIAVIPGATDRFEEPGALDRVVDLAAAWFRTYVQDYPERTRAAAP